MASSLLRDGPSFQGKVIAVISDFGDKGYGESRYTTANIARWVRAHKGTFSETISAKCTHILCDRQDFMRKSNRLVIEAKKLQKKGRPYIVDVTWLEDAFVWDKVSKEEEYTLPNMIMQAKLNDKRGFKSADYRIYQDQTNFKYNVKLLRTKLGKAETYIITLFESLQQPRNYICGTQFFKHKDDVHPSCITRKPMGFEEALVQFKRFFLGKTRIQWDARLVQKRPSKDLFYYRPPSGNKPKGIIHRRKNMPVEKVKSTTAKQTTTPATPETAAPPEENAATEVSSPRESISPDNSAAASSAATAISLSSEPSSPGRVTMEVADAQASDADSDCVMIMDAAPLVFQEGDDDGDHLPDSDVDAEEEEEVDSDDLPGLMMPEEVDMESGDELLAHTSSSHADADNDTADTVMDLELESDPEVYDYNYTPYSIRHSPPMEA